MSLCIGQFLICNIIGLLVCSAVSVVKCEDESRRLLFRYNQELQEFNHLGAELAWNMSTNLDSTEQLLASNEKVLVKKNVWNNEWCLNLLKHPMNSISQMRQVYLICRGPRFTSYQLSNVLSLLAILRKTYDTGEVCLSSAATVGPHCYRMEPELNHLMETERSEPVLREAWVEWHTLVGKELSPTYVQLVRLMNTGARQAGRSDIGSCWRDELETNDLVRKSLQLYSQVKPLYSLLHAFVRFKLGQFYGLELGSKHIPAHLLGNMWSQKWDSLMDILWPEAPKERTNAGNQYIVKHIGLNATVKDMVKYAENYYVKMGFPALPPKFHENSYFESNNSSNRNCHGSSANMFGDKDYRIMMCASVRDSDLEVLIHEMGHIHYFMAYEHLPTIFKDGANAAFHEAVGDSVTYGMYANPDLRTLFRIALAKLPQVSFGLIVDLWRWKVFENEDDSGRWNEFWWDLNREYLGITPPDGYHSHGLDALGKYHIVDNIPYIRYFYGSFLQQSFYESMCRGSSERYCNLEQRGDGLRRMLSRGSSTHWSETLEEFTGSNKVTADALLNYFEPLKIYLEIEVEKHNLSLGW